jgi:cobalt-zinc-cadmium efflux system protein
MAEHDHHSHGPHHHGPHHHGPSAYDRAFAAGISLNLGFVAVEVYFGWSIGSLALLADAGHNFGDALGLLLAWLALWLTRKSPSKRRTYGYGRSTILASLVNAVLLLIGSGGIAWEAVLRFGHAQPVPSGTVMWVAGLGIAINAGTALMFLKGRRDDLNIRGAFLHMASDAAVAAGVVAAAAVMGRTGWLWLDPACSLAIVVIIAIGTWDLFRDSLDLAMDSVPAGIDGPAVEAFLTAQPGITAIHDLHIWPLSTSSVALTAHLVCPATPFGDDHLNRLAAELHDKFGIDHATMQVERGDGTGDCRLSHGHA